MRSTFYHSLRRNQQMLSQSLSLEKNDDIVSRSFTALGQSCALYYVEGMASGERMDESVLRPLLRAQGELSGRAALEAVTLRLIEAPEVKCEKQPYAAVQELMRGQVLLLMDSVDEAVLVDLRGYVRRAVSIPQTENVVIGPHEAFTEPLRDNLTMLHRMLPSPLLICKLGQVGTRIPTQTAVCWLDGICPQETLDEIERRLSGAALDHVLTVGELSQLIEDDPFAPLPQVVSTERPDRAVSFLLEGQAVLLIDGSPRCLAMPVSLWHLFHAPDDTYMRWMYGAFMRVVRAVGAALALLLPAVFVSLVIFHPLALPMSLLTNIIQSRSIVSISLFGEAVLMLTVFDLINEAGTRIPGLMGSSFGLVSALILGTAAVDAGLVSPLLIIVVALSGLGSYALPNYSLSFAFRMGQMALLIAGGLMGLPGVCLLLLLMVLRVAGMESLGRPFLAPVSPRRTRNPDLIFRAPLFRQRLRSYLAAPENLLRAHGRMRRFDEGRRRQP